MLFRCLAVFPLVEVSEAAKYLLWFRASNSPEFLPSCNVLQWGHQPDLMYSRSVKPRQQQEQQVISSKWLSAFSLIFASSIAVEIALRASKHKSIWFFSLFFKIELYADASHQVFKFLYSTLQRLLSDHWSFMGGSSTFSSLPLVRLFQNQYLIYTSVRN